MEVVIPKRFCGPPDSGNGGWVSGVLAGVVRARVPRSAWAHERPAVSVRLSSPPPLERALTVVTADHAPSSSAPSSSTPSSSASSVRLLDGTTLVATATSSSMSDDVLPQPATMAQAQAAESAWEGSTDHPFPTCVVCGPAREPDDGLALRPGPLGDGSGRYATTWVPRNVEEPFVWAALDCPGGWSAGIAGRPMVLGTMTAQVLENPVAGEPYVVTAWSRGARGRLHLAGTALHTAGGRLLARAESVWVAVDPAAFGAPASRTTGAAPTSDSQPASGPTAPAPLLGVGGRP